MSIYKKQYRVIVSDGTTSTSLLVNALDEKSGRKLLEEKGYISDTSSLQELEELSGTIITLYSSIIEFGSTPVKAAA